MRILKLKLIKVKNRYSVDPLFEKEHLFLQIAYGQLGFFFPPSDFIKNHDTVFSILSHSPKSMNKVFQFLFFLTTSVTFQLVDLFKLV